MAKLSVTQIRLPAEMHGFIKQEAERTGISQNSVMLMLLELGKRIYDDPAIRQNVKFDEPQIHTAQLPALEKIQSGYSCSGFRAPQLP